MIDESLRNLRKTPRWDGTGMGAESITTAGLQWPSCTGKYGRVLMVSEKKRRVATCKWLGNQHEIVHFFWRSGRVSRTCSQEAVPSAVGWSAAKPGSRIRRRIQNLIPIQSCSNEIEHRRHSKNSTSLAHSLEFCHQNKVKKPFRTFIPFSSSNWSIVKPVPQHNYTTRHSDTKYN